MNPNVYRWCAVSQCTNTTIKTPNKLFINVPMDKKVRNKWLDLARRERAAISNNSVIYFCEDHFDLPKDMENYMQYHIMGSVSKIRMKSGCIPTKFECRPDRRKRTSSFTEHSYAVKKRTRLLIEETQIDKTKRVELALASTSSDSPVTMASEEPPSITEEPPVVRPEKIYVKMEPGSVEPEFVTVKQEPSWCGTLETDTAIKKEATTPQPTVTVKIEPYTEPEMAPIKLEPCNEERFSGQTPSPLTYSFRESDTEPEMAPIKLEPCNEERFSGQRPSPLTYSFRESDTEPEMAPIKLEPCNEERFSGQRPSPLTYSFRESPPNNSNLIF